MNDKKLSSKFLFITLLSLGLILLGSGIIVFTANNMWMQSGSAIDDKYINYSVPEVSPAKKDESTNRKSSPSPTAKPVISTQKTYTGDEIGTLSIPVLKLKFSIIDGTGADELKRGVGHVKKTALPGESDNCVLSGHRETVFRNLGKVKIGDAIIAETSAGEFVYKVYRIRIVDDNDRTVAVHTDNAVLTLTTCYPFDTPGYFPQRYIVSAKLILSK